MEECVRDIIGYEPFYKITDQGRIYSKIRNRYLKPYPNPKGYLLIDLRGKAYSVHRLVARHFSQLPLGFEVLQINHKDGNKKNNKMSNLEWTTNLENQRHSWENGRQAAKGSKVGASKLVEEEVLKIIAMLKKGNKSQREIALEFNVAKSTIGKINTKKNWAHLWN